MCQPFDQLSLRRATLGCPAALFPCVSKASHPFLLFAGFPLPFGFGSFFSLPLFRFLPQFPTVCLLSERPYSDALFVSVLLFLRGSFVSQGRTLQLLSKSLCLIDFLHLFFIPEPTSPAFPLWLVRFFLDSVPASVALCSLVSQGPAL